MILQAQDREQDRTLRAFRLYGNRTSSLATLHPDFASHAADGVDGVTRYQDTGAARVVGNEPLTPEADRARALADLAFESRPAKRCTVMPVGEKLAGELRERGFSVWQVGSEPLFDLAVYFERCPDPLVSFPLARALKRRGGEVAELDQAEVAALRPELEEMTRRWLEAKPGVPLGFLCRVEPFRLAEEKRYFVLRARGILQAFVAAAPCREGGAVQGYYLQDIVRHPKARAGASDLLILESLRLLHASGVPEARLGMAPLAGLARGPGRPLLDVLFNSWRWGYRFRSLHEFKEKFHPTDWRPLYLASTSSWLVTALGDALAVHLPDGACRAAGRLAARGWGRHLALSDRAAAALGGEERLPASLGDYLRRTRITTALVALFVALHALRLAWPPLAELFARSAYQPGQVTWEGFLLGPFFHNHWFHLFGDQLSFYLFGACIEILLGPAAYLSLLATGLWLSNPLTQAVTGPVLARLSPASFAFFLTERDYGSSNAVFAMVGAHAALLRRHAWLLIPFAIYGAIICLARESWLALHHLLTLAAGFVAVRLWLWLRGRQEAPEPAPVLAAAEKP